MSYHKFRAFQTQQKPASSDSVDPCKQTDFQNEVDTFHEIFCQLDHEAKEPECLWWSEEFDYGMECWRHSEHLRWTSILEQLNAQNISVFDAIDNAERVLKLCISPKMKK